MVTADTRLRKIRATRRDPPTSVGSEAPDFNVQVISTSYHPRNHLHPHPPRDRESV